MPEVTFSADWARAGTEALNVWVEFTAPSSGTYRWAGVAMPHAGAYYGGYKEARVLSYGAISRAMSDRAGQYTGSTFDFDLSDVDRTLRGFLADASADRFLRSCEVVIRAISDVDRRAGSEPRVIARGVVLDYLPLPGFIFRFHCEDYVSSIFGPARLDTLLPKRITSLTQFTTAPAGSLGLAEPIVYGNLAGPDATAGAVMALYVGEITLPDPPGTTLSSFLIAGHACKALTGFYQRGVAIDPAIFGVTWFAPGQAGWPYGTTYRDLAGRRYTLIYVQGPDASVAIDGTYPITVNVQGVESVGDGSGTLITTIPDQYEHFARCFLLSDYQTGNYPSAPAWGDATSQLDSASFVAATTVSKARLPADGYVGAGIIGALGEERLSVRDAMARFNLSCDVESFFNRKCQLAVSMLATGAALAETYDDVNEILEPPGLEIQHMPEEYYTGLIYSYGRDYYNHGWAKDGWQLLVTGATGPAALAPPIELWFVRTAAIAQNIGAYRLMRGRGVLPRRVLFAVGIHGLNRELGDVVGLTHVEGATATGWTARHARLEQCQVDLNEADVIFTARDIGGLSVPAVSEVAGQTNTAGGTPGGGGGGGTTTVYYITQGAQDLGGSRAGGADDSGYHIAPEYRDVTIDWGSPAAKGKTAQFTADVMASAGAPVTVALAIRLLPAGAYSEAAPISTTTWVSQTVTIADPGDNSVRTYRLYVKGNTDGYTYWVKSNPGMAFI